MPVLGNALGASLAEGRDTRNSFYILEFVTDNDWKYNGKYDKRQYQEAAWMRLLRGFPQTDPHRFFFENEILIIQMFSLPLIYFLKAIPGLKHKNDILAKNF